MKPVTVVDTPGDFNVLIKELEKARYIAVDTESNSFYAYFERVCLIQISTDEEDFIVDPLALEDMKALRQIFANAAIEKIFHAASNDVLGLKRDFQFSFRSLFDTAIACKFLGYKQLGLARILEEHFGVQLNKKWQRCDWGKRPLGVDQLNYARLDTHYLIELRHRLASELHSLDLWEKVSESFDKACEQEFQEKRFQPEGFIQINGARSLDYTGQQVLKALYLYREKEARRRNRAPFRILSNDTLIRLARFRPKEVADFQKIKGIPRIYQQNRVAHHLLEVIRKTEDFGGELRLTR